VRASVWKGFRAYLTEPHDGDTFTVITDGGFDTRAEPALRLYDVSAPELAMRLPPMHQAGGREATEFVNGWLARAQAQNPRRRWWLWVDTLMTSSYEADQRTTFRRYVARVWQFDDHDAGGGEPESLNYAVRTYLSGHPEWPTGE
jgi:endonuclease YncB( thermonuclease family)